MLLQEEHSSPIRLVNPKLGLSGFAEAAASAGSKVSSPHDSSKNWNKAKVVRLDVSPKNRFVKKAHAQNKYGKTKSPKPAPKPATKKC